MNVLVTGGAGYVGSRLVPALLTAGHRVAVLDKLIFGDESLSAVRSAIKLYPIDLRDVTVEHLRGVDAILHLAGISNDPSAAFNPAANTAINLEGTLHLANVAKAVGVGRFVFASSCSVYYSEQWSDQTHDESNPIQPLAPYSWSKHQAELGLLALHGPGFAPVIFRKGTIYGSSPRMRYDLVVNTFTCDAYAKQRLTIHCGGKMSRPLLHIEDAIAAYMKALTAPVELVGGRIFNVLSENYTVMQLAKLVQQAVQRLTSSKIELDVQSVGIARSYRVTGERFARELGFSPSGNIDAEVTAMWSELEAGLDPTAPIHYNIRWFELLSDMETRLRRMGGSVF